MLKIALIGRPNVGKSTLFNRLVGNKKAITDPTPGVTRDRHVGRATLGKLEFDIIDTAGLDNEEAALTKAMMQQTEKAVEEADAVFMMVDGRAGLHPLDRHFAKWLHKKGKPVTLLINKCEGRTATLEEFYKLGLGDPLVISAEHGTGLQDIHEVLEKLGAEPESEEQEQAREEEIYIGICGKPNAGKSTLLNAILGEERVLVSDIAGTTRDAITVPFTHRGRKLKLVDTAGMRRKSRIDDTLEKASVAGALETIRYANVIILLIDGTHPLEKQDLSIADLVLSEGRGLVIGINKWDLVPDQDAYRKAIYARLDVTLAQVKDVPCVMLSAANGKGVRKLLDTTLETYDKWNTRIPTSQLNRWFTEAIAYQPPPLVKGKAVKPRYITQTKTRPPTFLMFTSSPTGLPESYRRFLLNELAKTFELQGIPLRLQVRKKENPYAN